MLSYIKKLLKYNDDTIKTFEWCSAVEAGKLLGVCHNTVKKMLKRGELEGVKTRVNYRGIYFNKRDLFKQLMPEASNKEILAALIEYHAKKVGNTTWHGNPDKKKAKEGRRLEMEKKKEKASLSVG